MENYWVPTYESSIYYWEIWILLLMKCWEGIKFMHCDFHQLCSMNCMIIRLFSFMLNARACNGFPFLSTLYDMPLLSLYNLLFIQYHICKLFIGFGHDLFNYMMLSVCLHYGLGWILPALIPESATIKLSVDLF